MLKLERSVIPTCRLSGHWPGTGLWEINLMFPKEHGRNWLYLLRNRVCSNRSVVLANSASLVHCSFLLGVPTHAIRLRSTC